MYAVIKRSTMLKVLRKKNNRKNGSNFRSDALEHFQVKWIRFTVDNAVRQDLHFQVKRIRFTVENAMRKKGWRCFRPDGNGSSARSP